MNKQEAIIIRKCLINLDEDEMTELFMAYVIEGNVDLVRKIQCCADAVIMTMDDESAFNEVMA
jgi:hypothetical protein